MNKNANSADVRRLTRAIAKAERNRYSLFKSLYNPGTKFLMGATK